MKSKYYFDFLSFLKVFNATITYFFGKKMLSFIMICSKLLFYPIVLSWTIDLFIPLYWVFNFYWFNLFRNQIQNVNKNKSEHIFFDQSRVTDPPPPQAQKGQFTDNYKAHFFLS